MSKSSLVRTSRKFLLDLLNSIICVALALAFLSGCSSFHSVKDAEHFLASERTKKTKPKTDIKIEYTLPMDSGGNKALATVSGIDSIYLLPVLPLLGVKFAAIGIYSASVGSTAKEQLWVFGKASTSYGRFIEYNRVKDDDSSTHKFTVFDRTLRDVGKPPAPCEIVGKHFDSIDNTGTSRFKQTKKWCHDKEAKIFIGMSNYLEYGLFYRTAFPKDSDNELYDEKVTRCTKELAREHFNKVIQAMENIE